MCGLLSRDCKSLHACLCDTGRIVDFPNAKYIHTSRLSLKPLASALLSPGAEQDDRQLLIDGYFRQLLEQHHQSRSIAVVDVGFGGGVQRTIQKVFGAAASLYGYYVALAPVSSYELFPRVRYFFEWDRGAFCFAMTEVMFGFVENSCSGYERDHTGRIVPKFQKVGLRQE